MHRVIALSICLAFAACGGKSTPKTQPATEGSADDPDNKGIGQAEAAQQACYEVCYTDGAKGATDWATKSEADKQAACNAECQGAGAGMPSDQPAK